MNRVKMEFLFALILICLLVLALVFKVNLKNAFDKSSQSSQQPPSFKTRPATQEQITEVLKTVAIRDSLSITHRLANSYKLFVLIDTKVSFVPVGIQILDQNSNTPLRTTQLNIRQQSELECMQSADVNAALGKLIYETEDIYLLDQHLPNNDKKRIINLLIKTPEGIFSVEKLQIEDSCFWSTE